MQSPHIDPAPNAGASMRRIITRVVEFGAVVLACAAMASVLSVASGAGASASTVNARIAKSTYGRMAKSIHPRLSSPKIAAVGSLRSHASKPSSPCVFEIYVVTTCQSSDPSITLNGYYGSATTGCTFSINVNWGDKSPIQHVTLPGGPAGAPLIAKHTYAVKGVYPIFAAVSVTKGSCSSVNGSYRFTNLAHSSHHHHHHHRRH